MTQSQTLARLQAEAAAAQSRLEEALKARHQRLGQLAEFAGLIEFDDALLAGAFAELAETIRCADDARKEAWGKRGEPFCKRAAPSRRRAAPSPAAAPAAPDPIAIQAAGAHGKA